MTARSSGFDRRDLLTLIGLLVLAAVLRLPNLETRGTWEADQGHDMLVLRTLVRDGIIPLLGPPTSIGDVHHGAWYYYLLSPAAFLTGGDSPLAVVALIALGGIVAVGVVWWLARSVGGRPAGLAAGLIVALSAAAIDESTFIWNPNLIALSSGVALAAAWRAWCGGRPAWWIAAAVGTAVTMQCHVLGVALLPIVGALFVLDARRRPLGRTAAVIVVVFVLAYLPLAVNELTTDFSETRAALAYLGGDREATDIALPIRFVIVGLRVVSWPLVGLVTEALVPAVLATMVVGAVSIAAWWRRGDGTSATGTADAWRPVGRWFGAGLLWSTAFLTVAAPSLATVVPGLPNDHYHAFADPMVFVLTGLAAALAWRGPRPWGPVAAAVGLVALGAWNVTHLPPATHPDGGYPAGRAAAERVDGALSAARVRRDDPVLIRSLPDFKSTEALAYPLAVMGRSYLAETPKGTAPGSVAVETTDASGLAGLVLLCDDRFAEAIGESCGGAAEASVTPDGGGRDWGPLLDRFEAAPDRWVSVYGAAAASGT